MRQYWVKGISGVWTALISYLYISHGPERAAILMAGIAIIALGLLNRRTLILELNPFRRQLKKVKQA